MNESLPIVAIFVFAGAIVLTIQARFMTLQRRLDRLSRIEGKLDVVLTHLGIRFDPFHEIPADALSALREGRKIEAIKQYRHATGAGLAEAKDAIDEALRRH